MILQPRFCAKWVLLHLAREISASSGNSRVAVIPWPQLALGPLCATQNAFSATNLPKGCRSFYFIPIAMVKTNSLQKTLSVA